MRLSLFGALSMMMITAILSVPRATGGDDATTRAPLFSLESASGETFSLEENLGKGPIIVNFWATWCGPCILEMKNLKKVYAKYASAGLQMLAISIDDNKTQPQIPGVVRSYKFPYTILIDENKDVYKSFHVANVPQLFIIDARGAIVYSHQGYQKGDEKKVDALIAKLLAEKS
jgi:cytochrome c biogenesis protein CcmG, thiol:disulfide interchange protein DsbE